MNFEHLTKILSVNLDPKDMLKAEIKSRLWASIRDFFRMAVGMSGAEKFLVETPNRRDFTTA